MMMNFNPYNQYGMEPEVPHDDIEESMTPEERLHAGLLKAVIQIVMWMVAMMIGAGVCALLGSCTTTKYVTVPEYHTDTLLVNHTTRDSIWVHDSVWVNQWQAGDTVYLTRDRWHTQYVEKERHDTIYKSRTDSIPYPVEVIKEVPRKRGTIENMLLLTGVLSLILLVIFVAVKVKRFLP